MAINESQFENCKRIFLELGEEALYLSHYQLAMETTVTNPLIWKDFLMDPRIADYVASEMALIRQAAINHMVHRAPDSNSVGQSQLINALQKLDEKGTKKDGPAFIYCYVPPNDQQKEAPNIRRIHADSVHTEEDGSITIDI